MIAALGIVDQLFNRDKVQDEADHVKYYMCKGGQGLGRDSTHPINAASIVAQARTEHCGLDAYLFRKKLADSPACECGRGDETVLNVLLRCDRYAKARKELQEAAGDTWGDAS